MHCGIRDSYLVLQKKSEKDSKRYARAEGYSFGNGGTFAGQILSGL